MAYNIPHIDLRDPRREPFAAYDTTGAESSRFVERPINPHTKLRRRDVVVERFSRTIVGPVGALFSPDAYEPDAVRVIGGVGAPVVTSTTYTKEG